MNGADEEVELELPTSCVPCSGTGAEGGVLDTCGSALVEACCHAWCKWGRSKQGRTAPARAATGVERFRRPPARHARAAAERSNPPHFGSASPPELKTVRASGFEARASLAVTAKRRGPSGGTRGLAPSLLRTKPERPHHVPASRLRGPCARHDRHAGSSRRETARNPCPEGLHGWRHHRHSAPRLPTLEGWRRGDVVVLLKLHMPSKFPRQVRAALEELREDMAPKDLEARIRDEAEARRRAADHASSSAPSTNEVVARAARGSVQQARSLPNRPWIPDRPIRRSGRRPYPREGCRGRRLRHGAETGSTALTSHAAPSGRRTSAPWLPTFAGLRRGRRGERVPLLGQTRVETPCCKGNLVGTM